MKTYYLGLSVTYHDPALAIVDDQGQVLFAEATERYLQNKRALNCVADPLLYIGELLAQYCPPPCKFVIAINSRTFKVSMLLIFELTGEFTIRSSLSFYTVR